MTTVLRWRVKRRRRHSWVVIDPKNWVVGEFRTQAAAMAWADRRARTTEITLPVSTIRAGRFKLSTSKRPYGQMTVIYCKGIPKLHVKPEEMKPLALALLARHYEMNGEAA